MHMQTEFRFHNYYSDRNIFVGDEVVILITSPWSRYYDTEQVWVVHERVKDNCENENYRLRKELLHIIPKKDWEEKNFRYAIHVSAEEINVVNRPLEGFQWEV